MGVNLFSTVLALLAAFIFLANVMVFCTTKRKGVTWIFVTSLATSDILMAILVLPFQITEPWAIFGSGDLICKIHGAVTTISVRSSMFTVLLISADRYVAVRWPHSYRCMRNNWTGPVMAVVMIWLYSLGASVFIVATTDQYTYNPHNKVCSQIFKSAYENRSSFDLCVMVYREIELPAVTISVAVFAALIIYKIYSLKRILENSKSTGLQGRKVVLADRPMDRHVTNTLVVIAVFYTICFIPLCLYNTAHLIKPVQERISRKQDLLFGQITYIIMCLNSCINPSVVLVRTKGALKGIKEKIGMDF
ncbi:galanin receptor 2b-like [Bolinopsis microptera]|uniref:galanin receptor 2b-like n=1 Tax=Bolinopsis microptera TaxID=2820187 RepID=UPI00307AE247